METNLMVRVLSLLLRSMRVVNTLHDVLKTYAVNHSAIREIPCGALKQSPAI